MSSPVPTPAPAPAPAPPPDAILAVAAPNAVLSTPTPPPRKFPAPCWTQEETLALITTYQDKWYSLRRRNLRTADWDAVADEVNLRCPNQSLHKSSAQCRHKMEKLRKRYRTEKQRLSSLPNNGINGRFFGSNWVFFDFIHHMELGSGGSIDINLLNNHNNINHLNNNNNINNNNHNNGVGRVDLDVKPFSMNNNNNNNNNNDGSDGKKGDLGKYFDEIMMGMSGSGGGGGGGGGSSGSGNSKGKSQNREFDVRSQNVAAPHIKFKVKDHHRSRVDYGGDELTDDFEEEEEGYSGGFKRKMGSYESRGKGKDSVVGEMVASIRMLGEGMVKMEKMKMEMMRDIEKMRMEMEMKRSEMILESQHLIVNAFVQGLKKKSKKVQVMEID